MCAVLNHPYPNKYPNKTAVYVRMSKNIQLFDKDVTFCPYNDPVRGLASFS